MKAHRYKGIVAPTGVGQISMSNIRMHYKDWHSFLMNACPTYAGAQQYLKTDIPYLNSMALALKSMGYEIIFE